MTFTATRPAPITSGPVTHAGVLRKAAAAGIDAADLKVDSLGRYFLGSVFLETNAREWTIWADTGRFRARTMVQAFEIAKGLHDARVTMLAELGALSADELQVLILADGTEYTRVQYAMHALYTVHGWSRIKTR